MNQWIALPYRSIALMGTMLFRSWQMLMRDSGISTMNCSDCAQPERLHEMLEGKSIRDGHVS